MNLEAPGVLQSDEPPPQMELQAAMNRYLGGRGAGLRVTECERISGGFETFIYGIRVERLYGDGPPNTLLPAGERLILRIYRGPGVVERSTWEARIIERVRDEGVPVPPVYLYEPNPAPLGGPFLLLGLVSGTRMDQAALGAGPIAVVRMIRKLCPGTGLDLQDRVAGGALTCPRNGKYRTRTTGMGSPAPRRPPDASWSRAT